MAKILMYGGSGIISSQIADLAIRCGHAVTMVNRGKRKQFIHPKAQCILADMKGEPIETLKLKLHNDYDTIIDFLSYTVHELQRNMELAKGHCSQYIFISSATVYTPKEGRYKESDPIGNCEWFYANEKAACEKFLIANAERFGFYYTIIRPYVTYGETRIPLQFAPLEYYTIIHRMKFGKPVPVYEKDTACTLTTSKDFAVAAVGLIQNEAARGEVFHITGAYETTWNKALEIEAESFGVSCDMIPIPERIFRSRRFSQGLNVAEVIGDKSRDMLFDNSKIKSIVPSFQGKTELKTELREIVAHFSLALESRSVNQAWEGRVDRMLAQSGMLNADQKRKLCYCRSDGGKKTELLVYFLNRYTVTYYLYETCKKAHVKLKKILKR